MDRLVACGFVFVRHRERPSSGDRDHRGLRRRRRPQADRTGSPRLSRGPRWPSPAILLRDAKAAQPPAENSRAPRHCPAGPFVGRSPSQKAVAAGSRTAKAACDDERRPQVKTPLPRLIPRRSPQPSTKRRTSSG
ncbi:hypothetical protein CEV34_0835 [Brucella pseudogrignonensis]|uniref:Uncharacterized protein n=1 Tax=Brucella pseudogrignonensis TaxID=419475 RepID=A0A256GNQ3_9HYPH|nr:hypothetical protein CEV34_0835 [Brucella pseudogrignonensis]